MKNARIDLHQIIRDAILKLAASGEIRNKPFLIDEAYLSLTSDDLHAAARDEVAAMLADRSIVKVGGRYRVAQMGTGHEESFRPDIAPLNEAEAFSRTDATKPKQHKGRLRVGRGAIAIGTPLSPYAEAPLEVDSRTKPKAKGRRK